MSSDQTSLQSIRSNIQKVTQYIKQIESIESKIGTHKDSNDLRASLIKIQDESKSLLGQCQKSLKDLNSSATAKNADVKIQKDRLTDELIKTVTSFQKSTKSCMEKLKKFDLQSNASFNKKKNNSHTLDPAEMQRQYDMEKSDVVQQRVQLQQDNMVELNMVQDRHKDIQKLESDIVDLNSIFKDLSVLVHDQGEVIDNIEMNMEVTLDTVEAASDQIVVAVKYNQKARRKKFVCWLLLAVALITLTLCIVLPIALKD